MPISRSTVIEKKGRRWYLPRKRKVGIMEVDKDKASIAILSFFSGIIFCWFVEAALFGRGVISTYLAPCAIVGSLIWVVIMMKMK